MAGNRSGNASLFNTPGPTPSMGKPVRQHKAMAMGADVSSTPRTVKMNQKQMQTGWCNAPGISSPKAAAHDKKAR